MGNADELKQAAARAALEHLVHGAVLGVGSGSTVRCFIAELPAHRSRIAGAVSSSERSTELLREAGIDVLDLNDVDRVPVYVDGADEIDGQLRMIKGGGGALTREKIIAAAADTFVCIADAGKLVTRLGRFPLPIEVIPMARALVSRRLQALGAQPRTRSGFVTDNGNVVIDAHGLPIDDPVATETELNQWPGVVTVGLFARRGADVALLASADGLRTLQRC
ncbi:MAG TPA: ribose-5-phosphate isomerase RpiA [Burkholderiaceae bacterium]|nr:ribose-5-phosphate isomerase RpiA [Burkholderiaceae bacterium]